MSATATLFTYRYEYTDTFGGEANYASTPSRETIMPSVEHNGQRVYDARQFGQDFTETVKAMSFEIERRDAKISQLLEALQDILSCVSVRIDDPRIKAFDAARKAIAAATE